MSTSIFLLFSHFLNLTPTRFNLLFISLNFCAVYEIESKKYLFSFSKNQLSQQHFCVIIQSVINQTTYNANQNAT